MLILCLIRCAVAEMPPGPAIVTGTESDASWTTESSASANSRDSPLDTVLEVVKSESQQTVTPDSLDTLADSIRTMPLGVDTQADSIETMPLRVMSDVSDSSADVSGSIGGQTATATAFTADATTDPSNTADSSHDQLMVQDNGVVESERTEQLPQHLTDSCETPQDVGLPNAAGAACQETTKAEDTC